MFGLRNAQFELNVVFDSHVVRYSGSVARARGETWSANVTLASDIDKEKKCDIEARVVLHPAFYTQRAVA
jgi:hypothetical protein